MIKIVVADPHPIIFKGVKSFFRNSTEISVIGKTINFLELLNFLKSKKIDIVLLEIDLPGLDGLQVIKSLKERFHYVNFLIFSSLNEEVYAIDNQASRVNNQIAILKSDEVLEYIVGDKKNRLQF